MAGGELAGVSVGVVDELEKSFSSRSRKFASRGTITSAGGGCNFGRGTGGASGGDAQAQSTVASSSHITLSDGFMVLELLLVVGTDDRETLSVGAFNTQDFFSCDPPLLGHGVCKACLGGFYGLIHAGRVPIPRAARYGNRREQHEKVLVEQEVSH